MSIFDPVGWEALRPKWNGFLGEARSNFDVLRIFHILLEQKLELFNNMRDGVSGLPVESTVLRWKTYKQSQHR